MDNLGFGLEMTLAGMGTVFGLLLVLMLLLMAIGALDRPGEKPAVAAAPTPPALEDVQDPVPAKADYPSVRIMHNGLTADQIAAITIAVVTHAAVRRNQAAPAMRAHEPGSHLYASRWVNAGRGNQNTAWRRK